MRGGRNGAHYLRAGFLVSTALCAAIATPGVAQEASPEADPFLNTEEHGVDVVTGRYYLDIVEGRIGPEDTGIALVRYFSGSGIQDNWSGTLRLDQSGGPLTARVNLGKVAETFTYSGSSWISSKANGGALTNSTNGWTYTAPDGTQIIYRTPESLIFAQADPNTTYGGSGCSTGTDCGLPVKLTRPNGATYDISWEIPQRCFQNGQPYLPGGGLGGGGEEQPYQCFAPIRMDSVYSNSSYSMNVEFESNVSSYNAGFPAPAWFERKSVTFVDTSQENCSPLSCSPGPQWPKVTYSRPSSNVLEIDNSVSGNWRITTGSGSISVKKPGHTTDTLIITKDSSGRVTSITDDGETKSYAWGTSGTDIVVDMTDADGFDGQVTSDPATGRPTTVTDAAGNSTTHQYDGNDRLIRTTWPEGNYVAYTRDARGNVTETRWVAKPGSNDADIVTSADYDASCANPMKCNKPNYTIDARGKRTDYSYSSTHGQITKVERPAPAGQGRPTTAMGYSQLYAKRKDTNGNLVNEDFPQWKLTSITSCITAATCAGSANEREVTIAYNDPNLLPTSYTVAAGDGSVSATTTMAYDDRGNLISSDGPLGGTDDTLYYFYDAQDRRRGVIGPDPDGTGAMRRAAARYTYDSGSRIIESAFGTASGTSEATLDAMTVEQSVANTYDANGNLAVQKLIADGSIYRLTQHSYDARNRRTCTAVRMNPAVWSSLPASACTISSPGADGPDRITRAYYDGDDRTIRMETGIGTAIAANQWVATFTDNGQTSTLADGENNLTTYEYDGHDRLGKTRYPVSAQGAGVSSTSDYERLGYDAASNVTSRRLRDSTTIAYGYDALNRVITKDLPGTEPTATYAYDLANHLTSATQGGETLAFAYDALGRNTSQTGPQGIVSYQYDAAGRRTRLTWPDGFYVTYDYNVDGSIKAIRQNGGAALASYGYDAQGLPTVVSFANGTTQALAFDAVGRLSSIAANLAGTGADNTRTFAYNPAGQIAQSSQSNNAYAFAHENFDRDYSANGLNQYDTVGGGAVGYDGRGNLTSSDGDTFTYSAENLLTGVSGAANLAYDPLGRLREVQDLAVGGETTRFAYDGLDLIGEYNSSGALLRRYVHGPGVDNPIVWYEGSGTTDRRFLHTDERGSIIAISGASGALVAANSYDEYGIPAAGNYGRFGYTGQVWLEDAGLSYYKARMYSPTLGRFMQTDPIGYTDGMNWYNYVLGDPVNYTDPLGLSCNDGGEYCDPSRPDDDGPVIFVTARSFCDRNAGLCDAIRDAGSALDGLLDGIDLPVNDKQFCAMLAKIPGDNLQVHGGGRAGLGFVPGAETKMTLEDSGRLSVTSTVDFGAGIAGQATAIAAGIDGDAPPDGTTTGGGYLDVDVQFGVSLKDVFSSGLRAAFSKGGGGAKIGATARYVLESQTTTRTIHDFKCH